MLGDKKVLVLSANVWSVCQVKSIFMFTLVITSLLISIKRLNHPHLVFCPTWSLPKPINAHLPPISCFVVSVVVFRATFTSLIKFLSFGLIIRIDTLVLISHCCHSGVFVLLKGSVNFNMLINTQISLRRKSLTPNIQFFLNEDFHCSECDIKLHLLLFTEEQCLPHFFF